MNLKHKNTDPEKELREFHLPEPSVALKEKVMKSANLAWEKTSNGNEIFVKPFPTFKFLLKYAAVIAFALILLFAAEISNNSSISSYGRHNADVLTTEENEEIKNMSEEFGIDFRIYEVIAEEKSKSRTRFEYLDTMNKMESDMDFDEIIEAPEQL